MMIIFSLPRAQPEVVHFLISNCSFGDTTQNMKFTGTPGNEFLRIFINIKKKKIPRAEVHTFFCLWIVNKKPSLGETSKYAFQGSLVNQLKVKNTHVKLGISSFDIICSLTLFWNAIQMFIFWISAYFQFILRLSNPILFISTPPFFKAPFIPKIFLPPPFWQFCDFSRPTLSKAWGAYSEGAVQVKYKNRQSEYTVIACI